MTITPDAAAEIEALHGELSSTLERLAWAILRDWPLAADAMQEAFVLLAEKWEEVPAANRSGWLVRSVQWIAHNQRRKRSRTDQLLTSWAGERFADSSNREARDRSAREDTRDQIEQLTVAIGQLPESQQQVVRMRLQGDLTFAEIAVDLNVPLGTVLSRMRLALEKLRKQFDDDHAE